ncbi:zf-HC2 domain-containing protein [Amycolatopsis granulosa]|uniref:zf-HC2 domain-containing protein n=1 Tax=Amycolatopsis granulosa TaxID=185684 RepID=UPI0014207957|nr:zf-HC2 domain-containing protein [Amycolatopsis granulosa]NIH87253.1 putative anti-sigma-YlaC factor YlaD [Amycolatopsis granulosa]
MDCATAREAISATLDGEDPGVAPAALDEHLTRCAACVVWQDEAAAVTRLVRLEPAATAPDVTERVLGHVPSRTTGGDWPRWALGLAAAAQMSIAVSLLSGPHAMAGGMAVQPGSHLEHESAAFNFAVAVALLWAAVKPGQARSQLPVLLSFTAVLGGLSLLDALGGRVGWERLASHLPLVLGVCCAALIARRDGRWPWPGNRAGAGPGRRAGRGGSAHELAEPRTPSREHQPPAARRRVA